MAPDHTRRFPPAQRDSIASAASCLPSDERIIEYISLGGATAVNAAMDLGGGDMDPGYTARLKQRLDYLVDRSCIVKRPPGMQPGQEPLSIDEMYLPLN